MLQLKPMSDYATKTEVQDIVNKAVDDLSEIIQTFATNIDERFDTINNQFKIICSQFDKLDSRIDEFNRKHDHLIHVAT